jgi:hypothetical protein
MLSLGAGDRIGVRLQDVRVARAVSTFERESHASVSPDKE